MTRTAPWALALLFAAALAVGCSSNKPPADTGGPAEPTGGGGKPGEAPKVDPASSPDLQVAEVYLENGYMRARIKNGGAVRAEGVQVAFFVDGKQESTAGNLRLNPGQEHVVGAPKLPPGAHVVKVVVDPENKVPEPDETNNAKEATLTSPP